MHMRSALPTLRILTCLFVYSFVAGCASLENPTDRTRLQLAMGMGNYTQTILDGNGEPIRDFGYTFFEGGATIQHNFGNKVIEGKIGNFRATRQSPTLTHTDNSITDALEYLSYSSDYGGIEIGTVNQQRTGFTLGVLYFASAQKDLLPIYDSHFQVMGSLQLAINDTMYFSMSLLHNPTLIAQGGIAELGVGGEFASKSSAWLGVGFGPYKDVQVILRVGVMAPQLDAALLISASIGWFTTKSGASLGPFGISVGTSVNID